MALAVLAVAQFLIALDYSIVYVALPSIAGGLHLHLALAQWVISAYAIPFAGFLILGGRLTDLAGARRLFVAAILIFGAASGAGAAAGDGAVLLAARGAQGLGAALLQPAVLGLIGATFPPGPARHRALAVWASVGASGLAAGAVLGGLLTSASWRLTLLVNVPLTLGCALGARLWIGPARPDRPDGAARRIPVGASLLGTAGVLTLALGLTIGPNTGWASGVTLASLGVAVLLLAGFVANERASARALIEPALRRVPSLRIGAAAAALYMASVGSEFYLLTLFLQTARRYPPLAAGLAFLPLALMVTTGSLATGRAVRRLPPAAALAAGFALALAGLAWLVLALPGSYAVLLPGLILSGFGHGIIYTSMFMIGIRDVPAAHQGTAGALMTTAQYLSGAVTLAVLTLVLGRSPHHVDFRPAFALIAGAAGAGLLLIAVRNKAASGPIVTGKGALAVPVTRGGVAGHRGVRRGQKP